MCFCYCLGGPRKARKHKFWRAKGKIFTISINISPFLSDKWTKKRNIIPFICVSYFKQIHMEVENMVIEPVGSMMSVQAQAVQKAEPVQPAAGSTDANLQAEKMLAPDDSTVVVSQVQGKEEGASGEAQYQNQQPSNEQIRQAVEKLNKSMTNSEAVFGIHEATQRLTIKIVDKDTKKVIKELPPEKTLDMIAKVWEMAGILVDERR